MQPVLIMQRGAPGQFREWQGLNGVPEISPPRAAEATSAIVTVDTSATLLAANPNRSRFMIQNLSTTAVYVKLGPAASATDFSFVLQGGTAAEDGKGGVFTDDVYTGIVTAVAASGVSRTVAAVEM